MADYAPYRTYSDGQPVGSVTGSIQACRHCGKKPANQHSLRESAQCDWNKKPAKEKAEILARKGKEAA